jgi:polyhydroxyalkanoate synthesis regulator phasin
MAEKDLLKKVLLAGVGLVDIAAEKIEKGVNELVRRGEESQGKGKQYAEDLVAKAKEAKEKAGKAFAAKAFATKEELQKLEGKLDEIINKLGGVDKE